MEGVYEELDEAKAEIEKLREELKGKAESSENLKKRHNEQIKNAREASLKIEEQNQEIIKKEEEISALKETFRELQGSLKEKESIVNHLRAANKKLRVGCDEKLKKHKEENEGLALALEEANGKSFEQEQQIQACREEIEGLKGCLSVLQKKCSEAEKRDNRNKEARERDDVVIGLEEGKRKIEEQLKWKKEQFCHLEEAHRKMKVEFKASEKEWDLEKSSLLDEMCSLQSRLDSQIRISEDLQNRLQICNQVLACEETRRKSLEAQFSDVQCRFENVFGDYQDAKSQLEVLTEKRDKEIASLRHSLGKKEAVLKETEYQKRQMERENEELQISLKEFQESQIQKASGSPSVSKLRNKMKCSEQIHKESIANLKAKEAELNSQLAKMSHELSCFNSQLENRDVLINELRIELKQMCGNSANLGAKEAEWKSQIEKVTTDLNNCEAELESRDMVIEELRMALENFQARKVEWKSRLEATARDLEKRYMSQLESKDEMIATLRLELDQLHEDYLEKLEAKETQRSSQLDKVTNDLNDQRLLLEESKDAAVKEMAMELEQVRVEFEARFRDQEADWKSQVETMMNDLKKCSCQLERKDQVIKELKLEFEQQHEDYCAKLRVKEAEEISRVEKVTNDLSNYRSALESKDAKIKALGLELEQVTGDFIENLKTKEAEWSCQLEMTTRDLGKCRSERDDRDTRIKELRMEVESKDEKIKALGLELEQVQGGFIENRKTKEAEWTCQLEMITGDLNKCRSERDDGDRRINKLELELESKDEKINALGLELEKVQEEFVETLKVKEAEWTYKLEAITGDLNECRSERDDRDSRIKELGMKLENCHSEISQLKLQNEEISVMLLVLKNGIFDAHLKIANEKAEIEENTSLLRQQLVKKNADIDRLQRDVERERENAGNELDKYMEMLMELSIREVFLREQVLQRESMLRKKLNEVHEKLERTNTELAERICQGNGAEFELYIWKSIAERFKAGLEESFTTRRELEASLLAQVIVGETIEQEKQCLFCTIEARDERIADIQVQIGSLESLISNFLEESLVEKIGEERRVESLESKFNSSSISFSMQLAEKHAEIDLAREEIEEKKITISEIEESKEAEMKKASERFENEKRNLLEDVAKLSSERENVFGFIGGVDGRIAELSSTDQNLMDMLENILVSCDHRKDPSSDAKENVDIPATTTKFGANSDVRLPFREINHKV